MKYLKFTDFRNHSKSNFDKIENGESFIIIRKGKPIAEIKPFKPSVTGWKRDIEKVKIKSRKSTLDYILEERNKYSNE